MAIDDIVNHQLHQLPPTRRRILVTMMEHEGMTADELAEEVGITPVAVRRHLTNLERDRLVEREQVRRPLGRPNFVYRLTEAAHLLFPNNYDQLANYVLRAIEQYFGEEAVERIFEQRRRELARTYEARVNGETLPARLEQLTQLREEDGYLAAWEKQPDGSFILHQYHCPIERVAEVCGAACAQELELFADLLRAEVNRKQHHVMGDPACSYQIRPK
jgi:predicted ArsR family transcriptional regulator